jgi:hypothetical protein
VQSEDLFVDELLIAARGTILSGSALGVGGGKTGSPLGRNTPSQI